MAGLSLSPLASFGALPLFDAVVGSAPLESAAHGRAADLPLEIILELPLAQLRPHKPLREPLKGVLRYSDGKNDYAFDVSVTTRGHSRLEMCAVPPLKIDFKRKQVEGSVFEGQNKLKLVTHCESRRKYYRYLEQEYALYRSYSAVTDVSFRVRKLQVTYRDSLGKQGERTRPAFFIESDQQVAARLGAQEVTLQRVDFAALDPDEITIFGLFQFMIGNTDWAIMKGRGGEKCCHNGLLLENSQGRLWVVPYDFDQAGLIDAEYALPADGLGIRSVRERLFRGLCTGAARTVTGTDLLIARRAQIEAQFPLSGQHRRANKRALAYINDFYTLVGNPRDRRRAIDDSCRATPELWRSP